MEDNKHYTQCKCESQKRIEGIHCDVENCVYHDGKCECYAGEICVGPKEADSSSETVCATFKPRTY